jgi:hypothetical protein
VFACAAASERTCDWLAGIEMDEGRMYDGVMLRFLRGRGLSGDQSTL